MLERAAEHRLAAAAAGSSSSRNSKSPQQAVSCRQQNLTSSGEQARAEMLSGRALGEDMVRVSLRGEMRLAEERGAVLGRRQAAAQPRALSRRPVSVHGKPAGGARVVRACCGPRCGPRRGAGARTLLFADEEMIV
jgi:hypothetical protein